MSYGFGKVKYVNLSLSLSRSWHTHTHTRSPVIVHLFLDEDYGMFLPPFQPHLSLRPRFQLGWIPLHGFGPDRSHQNLLIWHHFTLFAYTNRFMRRYWNTFTPKHVHYLQYAFFAIHSRAQVSNPEPGEPSVLHTPDSNNQLINCPSWVEVCVCVREGKTLH